MKNLIKIVSTQDSETLQIRFFPTDICNFNCSYCFPDSGNINKYRYPKNIETIIKNFRLLFDMYNKKLGKNKFHLIIIGGGEPTLWPYLFEFCKGIKETHDVYISVCSNGSRSLNWWKRHISLFDDVILSCHAEFVNMDHFISVADLLFYSNIKVTALMLMDAKKWDTCVDYIEYMKKSKYPWFIEAKPIVDAPGHGMDAYSYEQLEYLSTGLKRIPDGEWLLKNIDSIRQFESIMLFDDGSAVTARPNDIIIKNLNYFKDWKCSVALETILINAEGIVTGSCHEPIFSKNNINIFSETFDNEIKSNIEIKQIVCPRKVCSCQTDTHVTKALF